MTIRFKPVLVAALAAVMLPYGSAVSAAASAAATASAAAPASAAVTSAATAASKSFKQIIAGNYYSAALRADGSVWTWGRNLWGELGVLKQNQITSVAAPVRLPNLSGITAIATNGAGMQVGLKSDGTVWEWGSIVGLKASIRESALPQQVTGVTGATAAVALNSAGVALKGNGGLIVWTHEASTGKAVVKQVSGTYKWTNLVSSGDMAFALDAAGIVWEIGARTERDGTTSIVQPFRLTGIPALKQISPQSLYGQMYGIDRSGGALKWTLAPNAAYDGSKLAPANVIGKAVRIHPELKVKDIQAGMLLTEAGDVWTLEKGPAGNAGKVKGLSGIVSIASGSYHYLALDASGRVWGWGADNWNETGNVRPQKDGMVYRPVPIQQAIDVYVNGKLLVAPFPARIDNGSTSVPMKAVLQAIGGSFSVAADYSTAITYKQTTATLRNGGDFAEINGNLVSLPVVQKAFNGVEMIPVGLLKLLGIHATWDAKLGELRLTGAL
ncbi:hypothetical protein GZH47_12870 [Paenibacillus rhizovicinus]|uniref:Copper amine oxidase-like N-terminal domain-containing protein n=1 Tax=Paenibacillus rhizovicinus TaxID=2704463 RepID=A0A6C0P0A7_9BACL|nr:stalk domain-containing protein [Paenibacillus rhizovicinus]QHW31646.1 hypothetical protein GZH47_12870 [Paenibacillus rhizovicinus]